ncbi:ABC transporter ATP-binding protein [Anaerostipes sp.]|uniref:ABC transporter ATP-binding protein n=1 Tax=Anaerostipes sp. TaxID=1872530 RepID=UPI0025C6A558|nr:ABC transporter ATP-binding protein [Anaerostipes sp.]MBS7008815.1 ABC transporter ATP-binding protein [Anaerostipes sp.]
MEQQKIQVRNITVSYEKTIVIPKLNLNIPEGKITVVVGANGCGKSTMIKTVAGILRPDKGEILINGNQIRKQAPKETAKQMAVLPQSPQVPEGLLVKELVAYGRFPYQKPVGGLSEHDHQVIRWAMEATGIEELKDRRADFLSGGQRQRAFIAMALAQETEILILDEPTTYLDMSHQLEILSLLKELNQKNGTTIVMVIHEINHASRFADHIIGMKEGNMVFEGAPADVITEENLKQLYGIRAKLAMSECGSYPVCTEYELE